jgi:hypothetical protein
VNRTPNGVHLLEAAAQAQAQQPAMQMQIAAPLAADALIALVAAGMHPGELEVAECVDRAVEIVALSLSAVSSGRLQKRLRELAPPKEG